jgi:hypothetical protein
MAATLLVMAPALLLTLTLNRQRLRNVITENVVCLFGDPNVQS